MKRIILPITFLLLFSKISFSQTEIDSSNFNDDFLKAYSTIAFNPGYDGKFMIKKWQSDVKIFVDNINSKFYEKELHNIIQKLNNCIPVKISFTNSKDEANCIIKVDSNSKTRTHYEVSWDNYGNIYKSRIFINSESVFNSQERIESISQYLMIILGDFRLPDKYPKYSSVIIIRQTKADTKKYEEFEKVQSILKSKLFGLTDFDCKVLRFHYSKNIKAGLNKDDFWPSIKSILQ